MIIIKIIAKIIALPVLVVLILMQWIGIFFTGIANLILNLLSGLFWVTAILGYLFGVCTGAEVKQMLIIAFVIFLIPHICCWCISRIVVLRYCLSDFIWS